MIQANTVMNIAVWDGVSVWEPEGYELVDVTEMPEVRIGFLYDGETFADPNPPVEE